MADAPSPPADDRDASGADEAADASDDAGDARSRPVDDADDVDDHDGRDDADATDDRRLGWAVGAFLLLTGVYSFVVAGQVLLWFFLVLNVAVLWLLWRFVVAVERIAAAQERAAG
jgi:hypothetical protein